VDGPSRGVRLMLPLILGSAYGAAAGAASAGWLRTVAHRLPEEQGLPRRGVTWVAVATTVFAALVAAGQATSGTARATVTTLILPVLVLLSAIDIDTRRLPDRLTLPAGVAGVVGLAVAAALDGRPATAWRPLAGAVVLAAFYLVNLVIGDIVGSVAAMGLGDVKFALVLGALLGAHSWSHVVVATVLAFVSAGVQALVMILRGASRRSHLAFGPHMALGALVVLAAPGLTELAGAS